MKYDTTLKDVLWRGAPALLRQLVGVTAGELLASEYPATRTRRPDFVARLTDGRLYHLELQGSPDDRMAWRMLEYYGLIAGHHDGEPVLQQVLALTARAAAMAKGIAHPRLQFGYDVVNAEDLDAQPLLASEGADDIVLAILCRTHDMRHRVQAILGRLTDLDENERGDAVARLLVLSGLRGAVPVVMEEVRAMGIQIDIESNEYLKSVFDKGEAKGKAETLLRLLSHRFQAVPETRRAQVLAAPPEQLDAWLDAVLDAGSLDEIFAVTAH
jgi:hypothetical protein